MIRVLLAEDQALVRGALSALLRGKIVEFRLDSLIDIAHRLGMRVSIDVAA